MSFVKHTRLFTLLVAEQFAVAKIVPHPVSAYAASDGECATWEVKCSQGNERACQLWGINCYDYGS